MSNNKSLKNKIIQILNIGGFLFPIPHVCLAFKEEPKKQLGEIWNTSAVPVLAFVVFRPFGPHRFTNPNQFGTVP